MSYSPAFLKAIDFILPHEEDFLRGHWGDQKYVVTEHVAGDAGGATKYGIDAASHPNVDIDGLTRDEAIAIYHQEWMSHDLDALPEKIAIASMDVWVNGGHAVMWLQSAINQATPSRLPRLEVDGDLGPATLAALKGADEAEVINAFLQERDDRFEQLAERYPNDKQFLAAG